MRHRHTTGIAVPQAVLISLSLLREATIRSEIFMPTLYTVQIIM